MSDEIRPIPITGTEVNKLLNDYIEDTNRRINEMFYPGGRDAYVRVLERKFGLFPSE